MTKITLIGAGSTVFTQNILGDILSCPAFADCTIALHDIDADRLSTSHIVTRRICTVLDLPHVKIEATTDRRTALKGARFVILMFQIGGYRPSTVIDFDIPKKYGLRQTIGDTLGIGGIFRGLRTIPVLQDIAQKMSQLCPDGLLMNYVNPMVINCWAVSKFAPEIKIVGLCHSVQHTAQHLAHCLDENIDDIDYLCAGINMSISVQELTVLAALTGKRHYVEQAAMLDPHTASVLNPNQIVTLVGDMIAAHGAMLPDFV